MFQLQSVLTFFYILYFVFVFYFSLIFFFYFMRLSRIFIHIK